MRGICRPEHLIRVSVDISLLDNHIFFTKEKEPLTLSIKDSHINISSFISTDTRIKRPGLPQEKVVEVRHKLHMVLSKKKVTLKELQSLVGLLNFCARAIPSVRAFNRRFMTQRAGFVDQGVLFVCQ
jgi:hypothetical protein